MLLWLILFISPMTLKGIIASLYLALDGVIRIDVWRDYILEDSLVECKKRIFLLGNCLRSAVLIDWCLKVALPWDMQIYFLTMLDSIFHSLIMSLILFPASIFNLSPI